MITLDLESLKERVKLQLYAYYGNDAVIPFDLRKYGVAKEEIDILPNHRQGRHYMIQNTEILAIDKPNERCNSSAHRISIAKCVSQFLEKELGCSTRLLDGNQTMRTCAPELLKNYKSSGLILNHMPLLSEANMLEYFGCMPGCNKNNVELTMVRETDRTKGKTGEYNTTLKLMFNYVDGGYDINEEFYIYDFGSFMGDCGGFMGLLLGCSLLSLYHMVADWVTALMSRNKKHQLKAPKKHKMQD